MKAICFCLIFLVINFAQTNKLEPGVWQQNFDFVSDGLGNTFKILDMNRFEFSWSTTQALNRPHKIVGLLGTYKIDGDTLTLKIDQIKEIIGGEIDKTEPPFESGLFILRNGKTEIIELRENSTVIKYFFKWVTKKHFIIDEEHFYLLSSGPYVN